MYTKSSRLLSRNDFLFLKTGSKRLSTPLLVLYFKKSRVQSGKTRLGFSVSKKVGNAVERNRFKRIFKEAFRQSDYKNLNIDALCVLNAQGIKQFLIQFTDAEEGQKNLESELIKSFYKLLSLMR